MLISNVGNKGISLEIAHKDKDETTSQTWSTSMKMIMNTIKDKKKNHLKIW
jgi:hypothetical protein